MGKKIFSKKIQKRMGKAMNKTMNYYIALVKKDGFDWSVLDSTDKDFIKAAYDGICVPLEYDYKELRVTSEDLDTHLTYDVLETSRNA